MVFMRFLAEHFNEVLLYCFTLNKQLMLIRYFNYFLTFLVHIWDYPQWSCHRILWIIRSLLYTQKLNFVSKVYKVKQTHRGLWQKLLFVINNLFCTAVFAALWHHIFYYYFICISISFAKDSKGSACWVNNSTWKYARTRAHTHNSVTLLW